MRYTVLPLIGVNDIAFDMSPDEVRRAMGRDFNSSDVQTSFGRSRRDQFHEAGMLAEYDADWRLRAVEFYSPARVLVCNANVMKMSIRRARAVLSRLDPKTFIDHEGSAVSNGLSLAAWSPVAYESIDVRVETFLVGRIGYYDRVGEHG